MFSNDSTDLEGGVGETFTVIYPLVKNPSTLKVDKAVFDKLADKNSDEGKIAFTRYGAEATKSKAKTEMIA